MKQDHWIILPLIAVVAWLWLPFIFERPTVGHTGAPALARDFVSQLISAAAMYHANQGHPPSGFEDFVDAGNPPSGDKTISTRTLGNGNCRITPNIIDCDDAFEKICVRYYWNGGEVKHDLAPVKAWWEFWKPRCDPDRKPE